MRQNAPRDERTLLRELDGIVRRLRTLENTPSAITPYAELTHNTTQAITTSTITAITFNTEVSDTHGGHDTVTNNNRYTAPISGMYQVAVQAPFASNVTGKRELWLRRGDGQEYQTISVWPSTALDAFCSVSCPVPLTAGAYVEALVWQNSGVSLNLDNTKHGGQRMLIAYLGRL